MAVEVVVPKDFVGAVVGDLTSRRGQIGGMEQRGPTAEVVAAHVPLSEMFGYATAVRSMIAGSRDLHDAVRPVPRRAELDRRRDPQEDRRAALGSRSVVRQLPAASLRAALGAPIFPMGLSAPGVAGDSVRAPQLESGPVRPRAAEAPEALLGEGSARTAPEAAPERVVVPAVGHHAEALPASPRRGAADVVAVVALVGEVRAPRTPGREEPYRLQMPVSWRGRYCTRVFSPSLMRSSASAPASALRRRRAGCAPRWGRSHGRAAARAGAARSRGG